MPAGPSVAVRGRAPRRVVVPPGVTIGFGVDLEPAIVRVAERPSWRLARRPSRAHRACPGEHAGAGVPAPGPRLRPRADRRHPDRHPPVAGRLGLDRHPRPRVIERLFGPEPPLFNRARPRPARRPAVRRRAGVRDVAGRGARGLDPNALRLESIEWRARSVSCRALRRSVVRGVSVSVSGAGRGQPRTGRTPRCVR